MTVTSTWAFDPPAFQWTPYARAVAYETGLRDPRHYQGLNESELKAFWDHVTRIRFGGAE